MGSYNESALHCYDIVSSLNLTNENFSALNYFCSEIAVSEIEGKYSKPLPWIGIYISIALLLCILAMVADLFIGFRKRKFWFPSKYFSLNAVSITVIAVAMKLPVDLNSPMPSFMDQAAKPESIIFMCMMMANLMPSLASMDNNSLLANVIGLAILIITIIVNICMEINTGVIMPVGVGISIAHDSYTFMDVGYIYLALLLFFLILLISSAITVPISKQNLELKYQAISKTTLYNHCPQDTFDLEKLRQHVKRYWIMAETGSPQFVIASNPLCCASGIICVIAVAIHSFLLLLLVTRAPDPMRSGSDYKWSMIPIFTIQSIGVVVGVIAPICRCFTVVSFKSFARWNRNHLKVFKVEKYWTQKLCEWKESRLTFLSRGHRVRILLRNFKNLILSTLIGFQKAVVVTCKMIGLIPVVALLSFMYCSYYFNSLIKEVMFSPPSSNDNIDEDLSNYVLLLEDNMELAERTLKRISNSMNRLIQKAEKEQDNNLLKFLERSTGFEGVEKFDIYQVQPLLSIEPPNSWSLPIVTLTCIAAALPNIGKEATNMLFKCVGEGLFYTHIVEESLNNGCQYVNIQKAAMTLWDEVEDNHKYWLGKTLEKNAYEGKTSKEILEWFAHKAEEIVIEVSKSTNGGEAVEYLPRKLIVANSMYRIAQTIMLTNQSNILELTEEWLFTLLSQMIADIFVACFTNILRVITMKCHESAIEKREASVEAAAKLLGRTTEIIKRLEMHERLPSNDHDKMAFIDEWRLHLQRIP